MGYKVGLIILGQIGPKLFSCLKRDFLGKLTNTAIIYLLCPLMLQCLKENSEEYGRS